MNEIENAIGELVWILMLSLATITLVATIPIWIIPWGIIKIIKWRKND